MTELTPEEIEKGNKVILSIFKDAGVLTKPDGSQVLIIPPKKDNPCPKQ